MIKDIILIFLFISTFGLFLLVLNPSYQQKVHDEYDRKLESAYECNRQGFQQGFEYAKKYYQIKEPHSDLPE